MKLLLSILATVIVLVPTWVYLLVHHLLAPQGFWQGLVLLGMGLYFLGILQIVLLIAWVAFLVVIWTDY